MNTKPIHLHVAYIGKTVGYKGIFLINLLEEKAGLLKKPKFLFIEIDGLPVPFKIHEWTEKSHYTYQISVEEISSDLQARMYMGYKCLLNAKDVKISSKNIDPDGLHGWQVYDGNGEYAGEITRVDNYAGNMVLTLQRDSDEILIPLAEDLILSINEASRKLILEIPDGLKEL
jgi:16S rRNA processing protein RimM